MARAQLQWTSCRLLVARFQLGAKGYLSVDRRTDAVSLSMRSDNWKRETLLGYPSFFF